jgi:hypothetical protein
MYGSLALHIIRKEQVLIFKRKKIKLPAVITEISATKYSN